MVRNAVKFFVETLARLIVDQAKSTPNNTVIKDNANSKLVTLYYDYIAGKVDIIPHVIYLNKSLSALTEADFFVSDEAKAKSLRNIPNAKLEEGQFFCPNLVQLLVGDLGATPTSALLMAEPYDDIFNAGGILNSGEFTLKVNATEFLMKDSGTACFVNASSYMMKGAYEIPKSTIMIPGLENSAVIKTGAAMATNLGGSLRLHGAITIPKS